eukprot:5194375-Pyramimonas_sp.AAC.1
MGGGGPPRPRGAALPRRGVEELGGGGPALGGRLTRLYGWMDGWICGWLDGCMDGRLDGGWMDAAFRGPMS